MNSKAYKRLFFGLFITVMLVIGALAVSPKPAKADLINCTGFSGATCEHLFDLSGDASNWCEPLQHHGSLLSGTYTQNCLRSWLFYGTGDNQRYSMHNVEITQNAAYANWTTYDQLETYGGPDYSSDGGSSTTQVRIWSTNWRPNNGQDQRYYSALSEAATQAYCPQSGNTVTYGVTGPLGNQGAGVNWSQTDALASSCVTQPGSDIYSGYLNFTLQDSNIAGGRHTADYTIGFQMQNNFNNSKIDIGYSNVSRFTEYQYACGGAGVCWYNTFNHSMGSGTWTNNYIYGTPQNP